MNRATRLALAALLAAALLAAVVSLTGVDRAAVGAVLSDLSPGRVAAAFACYALMYAARGARYALLLPGAPPLLHLATISARHNFFNLLLPLRSGEASLPLMLRGEAGREIAEGAAVLVVCRVLDLLSVALFLLVGLGLLAARPQGVAATVVSLLAAGLLALALLRPLARAVAARLSPAGPPAGRVRGFVVRGARHLAAVPTRALLAAASVSLLAWLLNYLTCWLCLAAMAGDGAAPATAALAGVTLPQALVGATALHLTALLPINTPAGIGAWEAGWTAGFVLAGLPADLAAASAVGSHLLIFAFVAALAVVGWWLRPAPERPGPRAETLW